MAPYGNLAKSPQNSENNGNQENDSSDSVNVLGNIPQISTSPNILSSRPNLKNEDDLI